MSTPIEQLLPRFTTFQNETLMVAPLSGGLTNTNYRVEADGVPYVVRIPGAQTELLAVDRANEYYNARAASAAGVAPRIVHYLDDVNVMVLEFIRGETPSIARLNEPGLATRMARACKQLHAGPRFLRDFNMFRLTEYYLQVTREHEVKIPDGYPEYRPRVNEIESAFVRKPLPTVPCHNDLLAENYVGDGTKLWLIDFEYSGNNDPTFELGNTAQEQQFDDAHQRELCAGYFGDAYFGGTPWDKLARMKLNMIMSDVGWTLWAAIQHKISTIEYDFWGWAIDRWGRATQKMDAPQFREWLDAV
ncbi:MAG: phosphotransferase family protein [Chloroflexi bacterium]|nr:phosphotransferase family protein [Chloroflexota bacterium]